MKHLNFSFEHVFCGEANAGFALNASDIKDVECEKCRRKYKIEQAAIMECARQAMPPERIKMVIAAAGHSGDEEGDAR